jgi:hypothetical protein
MDSLMNLVMQFRKVRKKEREFLNVVYWYNIRTFRYALRFVILAKVVLSIKSNPWNTATPPETRSNFIYQNKFIEMAGWFGCLARNLMQDSQLVTLTTWWTSGTVIISTGQWNQVNKVRLPTIMMICMHEAWLFCHRRRLLLLTICGYKRPWSKLSIPTLFNIKMALPFVSKGSACTKTILQERWKPKVAKKKKEREGV